jgi:hypothetical protein
MMGQLTQSAYITMGGWPVSIPEWATSQAEGDRRSYRLRHGLPDTWNGCSAFGDFCKSIQDQVDGDTGPTD